MDMTLAVITLGWLLGAAANAWLRHDQERAWRRLVAADENGNQIRVMDVHDDGSR